MTAAGWTLFIAPTRSVLAVAGGAPAHWVGAGLEDPSPLPEAARQAGNALLKQLAAHPEVTAAEARVPPAEGMPGIQILALRALAIRPTSVDLMAILAEALGPLRLQAAAKEVSLTLSSAGTLPPRVALDAEKISWAVATLVGSSLRFVKHGTRRLPGGEVHVVLTHDQKNETVEIAVADDGAGIPPDRLPFIFDRRPGSALGVGLALPLVRQIVAAHGGSVSIQSSVDPAHHGTTVTLRLPAPRDVPPAMPGADAGRGEST